MIDRDFDDLFQLMGGSGGLEREPVELYGFDAETKLRAAAPAIFRLGTEWVGLIGVRGERVTLLYPDHSRRKVLLREVWRQLTEKAAEPHRASIEALLDGCGIAASRRQRAFEAIVRERIRTAQLGTLYQLRTPAGSSFLGQLREAGVLQRAVGMVMAHGVEYMLLLVAWFVLGRDALAGRVDPGWLMAWALLLFTMVPFRMLSTWWQGSVAIGAGGLLRQRLLAGALKLHAEEVRHEGAGAFLGRAIESESIESLALGGGVASGLALFEVLLAAVVLTTGAAPAIEISLLALWLAVIAFLGWRYWRSRQKWTDSRLAMTHDLIEGMSGHRTRVAQQPSSEWHIEEDRALNEYIGLSQRMDADGARLSSLAPRGWLAIAIAGLAPAFLGATIVPASDLAIALGGILLAWQALRRLSSGLAQLAGAAIAWRQVAPLFHAAARVEKEPEAITATGNLVVDARDVSFRYGDRPEPVLAGATLEIRRGDWILLEGESGGGKSTFTSIVAGLRQPTSGLLLRWGSVASAPQYHENHVLTGTFAFNLLMGRVWPPMEADLREAETVARELGLGPLLERMPGGMLQMVGETGWQLSQGERSRVFLARALLQNPDMVILDESFAALDPENLRSSLECALRRARTLMVVAHP